MQRCALDAQAAEVPGLVARDLVTDRYRAYDAARRDLGPSRNRLNNRGESSNVPIRRREPKMGAFDLPDRRNAFSPLTRPECLSVIDRCRLPGHQQLCTAKQLLAGNNSGASRLTEMLFKWYSVISSDPALGVTRR